MMKVSVIVTVHNAEKYLRESLDSVVGQHFSEMEILCMDGGSTDSSPLILREYAARDNRIRIIDDSNTGYGHKINEGIRLARGRYVSVLESDDMYCPDMLERLWTIAEASHADFVDADYLEFFDVAGQRYYSPVRMYQDGDYGFLKENKRHPEDMRQIPRYWTGLFKRDFLLREDIRMNESPGASFQDLSFRFMTSALAGTSYHVEEPVYLYRTDNPDSSVCDAEKAVVTADEYGYLKGELERRGITDSHVWRHYYTWKYNDLYWNMMRFCGSAREALFRRSYRELKGDREVLERNRYGEYSSAISDFLGKDEAEVAGDIESGYRKIREKNNKFKVFYERVRDGKLVIFGCGTIGERILRLLCRREDKILCCADNNRNRGSKFWGMEVLSPSSAVEKHPDALFIVASRLYGDEMAEQLRGMGIPDTRICRADEFV